MRFRLPRRRIWRIAIYLICLDMIVNAADLVLVRVRRVIHPGFDTTRIVSPTLPDGRIDYLKFLDDRRSEGVTPLNNAAIPFLQAIGRSALPKTQPPDGITDRLGMPHLPEQGDYLTSFADYSKLHSLPAPPDDAPASVPTAWPPNITPTMQQWIAANAHPLDLLLEASFRTRFSIPFDGGNRPEMLFSVLLPHVGALPNVQSTLLTRALFRLQSGDSTSCIQDILAVHRLARLVSQCPTLIERMSAQSELEIPALQADRLVAASGKLSSDQLMSFALQLHALGDLPPIANYVDNERMLVLDATQALAYAPDHFQDLFADPQNSSSTLPKFLYHFVPFPWEANMRALNHTYDGGLSALRQEPYSRRAAALQLWDQQVSSMRNPSPTIQVLSLVWTPDFYVSMLMFSISHCAEKQDVAVMQKRLTEISLSLAAYKADHAQYPATLTDLLPKYLAAVPIDLFTEHPPIYRPAATGYVLYSVGPDMTDNAGNGDDIKANLP